MNRTFFITGANRGIGLELTRQILERGDTVIATARQPDKAKELGELARRHDRLLVKKLDVTAPNDLKSLIASIRGLSRIDVLINNAGLMREYNISFEQLSLPALEESFRVNVAGPIAVTQALLPFLKKSPAPKLANITSKMGSIADNASGGAYGYRMSKAALNMFNKGFALEFPQIVAVVLHPGWVKTDMGGEAAPLSVNESVNGLLRVIDGLKPEHTGRFFGYNGEEIPW